MRFSKIPSVPPLDDSTIPGEALVSHAVGIICSTFAAVALIGILIAVTFSVGESVKGSGTIEPAMVAIVRATAGGEITSVSVETGQHVEEGQSVAFIDSSRNSTAINEISQRLNKARLDKNQATLIRPLDEKAARERETLAVAGLSRARTKLQNTLLDYGIVASLDSVVSASPRDDQIAINIARADVLEAESQQRSAQLALARLKADSTSDIESYIDTKLAINQLSELARQRKRLTIRSPVSGVVLSDHLEQLRGRVVVEGDPVIEIGAINDWRADLLLAERDVRKVAVGQAVVIEFSSEGSVAREHVAGQVRTVALQPVQAPSIAPAGISPAGMSVPQYLVQVTLTQSPQVDPTLLRRGATVNARIELGHRKLGTAVLESLGLLKNAERSAR